MPQTKFKSFVKVKSDDGKLEAYAHKSGTTGPYITAHLMNANKVPRRDLMRDLVLASDGELTREDLLEHFYPVELFDSKSAA